MKPITPEVITAMNALGWTVIHSLWQGTMVFTALWIALKILSKSSARLRYSLNFSALLLIFGCSVWTFVYQYRLLLPAAIPADYLSNSLLHMEADPGRKESVSFPLLSSIPSYFPWISALYCCGVAAMLLRMGAGLRQLYRIRHRQNWPANEGLLHQLHLLTGRIGLNRKVLLRFSSRIRVPVVLGAIRPIILLPIAAVNGLSTSQLEAILLHELAHIKRQDYLLHILQHIIEILLFFHPAIWAISAAVRREREYCCDDLVVQYSRPYDYATALARLEESRIHLSGLALAASGSSGHLFHRIKRIMEMKKHTFSYGKTAAAGCILLATCVALAWTTPLTAQSPKEKPETAEQAAAQDTTRSDRKKTPAPPQPPVAPVPPDLSATLSEAMASAGEALKQAAEALKTAGPEVSNTIRNIDWNNISAEVAAAAREAAKEADVQMKEADWEEIRREIEREMDQIDWNQVKNSVEQVDWESIRKELRQAMEDVRSATREPLTKEK